MDIEDLMNLLKIKNRKVLNKSSEYSRLIKLKRPMGLGTLEMCKPGACIFVACKELFVELDKSLIVKVLGTNDKLFEQAILALYTILGKKRPCNYSIPEIIDAFNLSKNISELSENLLQLYKNKVLGGIEEVQNLFTNIDDGIFSAASVYIMTQQHSIVLDHNLLMKLVDCSQETFQRAMNAITQCCYKGDENIKIKKTPPKSASKAILRSPTKIILGNLSSPSNNTTTTTTPTKSTPTKSSTTTDSINNISTSPTKTTPTKLEIIQNNSKSTPTQSTTTTTTTTTNTTNNIVSDSPTRTTPTKPEIIPNNSKSTPMTTTTIDSNIKEETIEKDATNNIISISPTRTTPQKINFNLSSDTIADDSNKTAYIKEEIKIETIDEMIPIDRSNKEDTTVTMSTTSAAVKVETVATIETNSNNDKPIKMDVDENEKEKNQKCNNSNSNSNKKRLREQDDTNTNNEKDDPKNNNKSSVKNKKNDGELTLGQERDLIKKKREIAFDEWKNSDFVQTKTVQIKATKQMTLDSFFDKK